MGNRHSSSDRHPSQAINKPNACQHCAAPVVEPLIDAFGVESCRRCGLITPQKSSSKNRSANTGSSNRYTVNDENKSSTTIEQFFNTPPSSLIINHIRYHHAAIVQIIPFQESLSDEIKALANSDYTVGNSVLLEDVVQPFFQSVIKNPLILNNALITHPSSPTPSPRLIINSDDGKSHALLRAGIRLKISHSDHLFEFKIINCYPPNGILTDQTKFFAFHRPLSNKSLISRIEVAPTQASLQTSNANSAGTHHSFSPIHRPSRSTLLSNYVRPYFQSNDSNRDYIEGELFVSNGIQFRIISCAPTNGIIRPTTEFIVSSETIKDMKKIHLLPILETLPNNFKSSNSQQRINRYLAPYFIGSGLIVSKNDKIEIDGVKWKVISCEPDKGMITTATEISSDGSPLNSDDVKRQQEIDDEALARQLQMEEAAGGDASLSVIIRNARRTSAAAAAAGARTTPTAASSAPRTPNRGTTTAAQAASPAAATSSSSSSSSSSGASVNDRAENLRNRLNELLQLMPADDPQRVILERLHQHLSIVPFNGSPDRQLLALLLSPTLSAGFQSAAAVPPASSAPAAATPAVSDGATQAELDSLPCHQFKKRVDDKKSEASTEANTCRVCLDEYENGDIIRTLPCFHQGHKACFDNWLLQKPICPCCRFSIRAAHT